MEQLTGNRGFLPEVVGSGPFADLLADRLEIIGALYLPSQVMLLHVIL